MSAREGVIGILRENWKLVFYINEFPAFSSCTLNSFTSMPEIFSFKRGP